MSEHIEEEPITIHALRKTLAELQASLDAGKPSQKQLDEMKRGYARVRAALLELKRGNLA